MRDMEAIVNAFNAAKVSSKLKASLIDAGVVVHFPPNHYLFEEEQEDRGVYLVLKGNVRVSVKNLQEPGRVFSSGSLLGVAAAFVGRPSNLAAMAVTDAEVVHLERQAFLDLMAQEPELCREATDMLSREVSFIQSALAERRHHKRMSNLEVLGTSPQGDFTIVFDPHLPPETIRLVLSAMADY